MKILTALSFLTGLALVNPSISHAIDKDLLEYVIEGNHRSEAHKERDQYRHPLQTLDFFDVEPGMTVVEIWPGGEGWYTEILAPYLRNQGRLYAAHFAGDSETPFFRKSREQFVAKMQLEPNLYNQIKITRLQPPQAFTIAPPESADRVLTFRNIHNWIKDGYAEDVFKALYLALKKGGILGVVEHRAKAHSTQDLKAESGYVTEEYVIALAETAGFKFLAKSEINANSQDTTNHPKGVWTLPPTLRLGEQNKAAYLSIGESDRMTLKFIKE